MNPDTTPTNIFNPLLIGILLLELCLPNISLAAALEEKIESPTVFRIPLEETIDTVVITEKPLPIPFTQKPSGIKDVAVPEKKRLNIARHDGSSVTLTAYSSTVDQTDSSPCITANGFNVCSHGQENVIAANFLPFGTKVRIPDLFGTRVFTVQDRMNARYSHRVDVWMKSRSAAKQFGVKHAKIEIVSQQLASR